MPGEQLAMYVHHCLSTGLHDETSILLDQFTTEVVRLRTDDFPATVLPFLRGLAALMPDFGMRYTDHKYQTIFYELLTLYLDKSVSAKPLGPTDWTRKPPVCEQTTSQFLNGEPRGPCHDCQTLQDFLLDGSKQDMNWKVAKYKHSHLIYALLKGRVDCKSKTTGSGRDYHLLVTKTNDLYDQALREWEDRRQKAEQELGLFDQQSLKELLGDRYDAIMTMSKQTKHETEVSQAEEPAFRARGINKKAPETDSPNTSGHVARNLLKRRAEEDGTSDNKENEPKRHCGTFHCWTTLFSFGGGVIATTKMPRSSTHFGASQ
jgi:hypothetical protein